MLLTVDMGNTNINFGVFEGDDILFLSRIATDTDRTGDQYAVEILNIFKLYGFEPKLIEGSVISSVVPELTSTLVEAIEKLTDRSPLILGPGLKTGINILTDNPAQVGSDLIAGAVAAKLLYPLPCLVVDLGTATKISIVDESGAFLGCTISAGISISLDALADRTSQLPNISLVAPASVIGKNTIDSMQAGTVFGAAAMIDGLCDRIEEELGRPVGSIVATGGLSSKIVKNCKHKIEYNGQLLLEGLKTIYYKNSKQA
ncbi:MAG TPA: type III pantothenate kinase [Clostridiales bacterium]|jgi:type III pantothenate kinase|nr:type III pantothenate kinase [Clostridiales bacterium]HRT82111.1 type III pantothenate kinase [Oscillospiraceae bacterium]